MTWELWENDEGFSCQSIEPMDGLYEKNTSRPREIFEFSRSLCFHTDSAEWTFIQRPDAAFLTLRKVFGDLEAVFHFP